MAKQLDQDILLNIIVRLPVKSILRFRCVSKDWCKILKEPDFVKKHLSCAIEMNKFSSMLHPFADFHEDTYTLAYDHSSSTLSNCVDISYPCGNTFWGTCNGLICLTAGIDNDIVLWNPATMEFKELPTLPMMSDDLHSYSKHGFGYNDKIDDFKVVSLFGFQEEYVCVVYVYSLKSNSWRSLESIDYDLCYSQRDMAQVTVNGAMHWLALTESECHKVIVSFCFKDDRFDEMPLPSCLAKYRSGETNLCSLGGSLCVHGCISWYDGIDVWVMKEYGVIESWAKLFTFNQTTICEFRELVPLQVVNNGEVLLGYDTDFGFHLDLYDIKSGISINLKALANRIKYAGTSFVYVESLVTVNSGTYVELPEIEDPKEGFLASPKSVYEARETSPRQSCEMLDRYNHYVEKYMDLKRRKLDLKTRKLDFKIRVQENRQESQHMSTDTSKMNALQLKWWQIRANQIAEKCRVSDMIIGDVNDDKEEDRDRNDIE